MGEKPGNKGDGRPSAGGSGKGSGTNGENNESPDDCIQNNNTLPDYTTKFVVTQDGSLYALVIINQLAAQNFSAKYPNSILPGFPPDFTDYEVDGVFLFDEYQYSREFFRAEGLTDTEANEGALAYILDSFNAGIALLKMNDDGTFSKIIVKKTGGETTSSTFIKTKCQ